MAYETINEKVDVVGIFSSFKFTPCQFRWNKRDYEISQITAVHEMVDGSSRKKIYSVLSQGTLYLLEYNLNNEEWKLKQLWQES